jgi:hypothetical protein
MGTRFNNYLVNLRPIKCIRAKITVTKEFMLRFLCLVLKTVENVYFWAKRLYNMRRLILTF